MPKIIGMDGKVKCFFIDTVKLFFSNRAFDFRSTTIIRKTIQPAPFPPSAIIEPILLIFNLSYIRAPMSIKKHFPILQEQTQHLPLLKRVY